MRRKLFHTLLSHLRSDPFILITGARQTGKTTLLKQLGTFCIQHQIPVLYLDCADQTTRSKLNRDLNHLPEQIPDSSQRAVVLIDDIHLLKKPISLLINNFEERADQIKIVAATNQSISTSDPVLRNREVLKQFHLPACSFNEYMELRGVTFPEEKQRRPAGRLVAPADNDTALREAWEEYLLYGGYPAVIMEPNPEKKKTILRELSELFLFSDAPAAGVQNSTLFGDLVKTIALRSGDLINSNELTNNFQTRNITTRHYLEVMEKMNHLMVIRPFSQSYPKELTKMPKGFFADTGLRNAILNDFRPFAERSDKENIWKTAFLRQLSDKFPSDEIYFWRTTAGQEIDFVMPGPEKPMAIVAECSTLPDKKRDVQGFTKYYPHIQVSSACMETFDQKIFSDHFR